MDVSDYFADSPLGIAVHQRVLDLLAAFDDVEVRVGRSAVSYRRRRAFAWLWLPGTYLARPSAELVLSVALARHDTSTRFKNVVHPSRAHWIHHLEVHARTDVDDEVAAWLREAAARAG
jgi:hypothetical protein